MKTLILNGSPRKRGETASMMNALLSELPGEVQVLNAFEQKISPCVDCRYCRTHAGCAIKDGMQALYRLIEESDNIVIASPIWFAALPGPLLTLGSRAQCYFSARFFRKEPLIGGKKGAVLLSAGGSGGVEEAFKTASILLRELGAEQIAPVAAAVHTDTLPAAEDTAALQAVRAVAEFLRG
ncbi:MAG: flavodoxin family protein [Clostridia bacterium]|nr:flavodoxin family protein [Clostridia bacterium]